MDALQLMERHKPQLIETLRSASPALHGNAETSAFLSRILDDDEQAESHPPTHPAQPGEDTFWWCVEQLLLIANIYAPPHDPQRLAIIEDLKAFADRLERNEPLPPGYGVGWLDFDVDQTAPIEAGADAPSPPSGGRSLSP